MDTKYLWWEIVKKRCKKKQIENKPFRWCLKAGLRISGKCCKSMFLKKIKVSLLQHIEHSRNVKATIHNKKTDLTSFRFSLPFWCNKYTESMQVWCPAGPQGFAFSCGRVGVCFLGSYKLYSVVSSALCVCLVCRGFFSEVHKKWPVGIVVSFFYSSSVLFSLLLFFSAHLFSKRSAFCCPTECFWYTKIFLVQAHANILNANIGKKKFFSWRVIQRADPSSF